MSSAHPAIMVGYCDEVIATRPSIGIDQELRHVQVSAGNTSHSSEYSFKPKLLLYIHYKYTGASLSALTLRYRVTIKKLNTKKDFVKFWLLKIQKIGLSVNKYYNSPFKVLFMRF